MDKKEIVKKFFEKGKLLTPDALDFLLSKQDIDFDTGENFILTKNDFSTKTDRIKVIKNLTEVPKELNKADFIRFYTSKYEKLRTIISERIKKKFVSLNNIIQNETIDIIGIVRDIKKDKNYIIELEDITGSVKAIFNEIPEDLDIDDVIAVEGIMKNNVFYGSKIFYPDIPLRDAKKSFGKACFISDLHLDEAPTEHLENFMKWFEMQDIKYLFVAGDIGDNSLFEKFVRDYCYEKKVFVIPGKKDTYPVLADEFDEKNIISLSNPSMVEINGIKILLIHDFNLSMLKKRYLGRTKLILKEDYLVLEDVPDIVHCGHTHEPQVLNHKSVTIVNAGSLLAEFRPVVIDFSTREFRQLRTEELKP